MPGNIGKSSLKSSARAVERVRNFFTLPHARYFIFPTLNFSYIGFKRPIAQLRVGRVTLNNSYHSRVVGMSTRVWEISTITIIISLSALLLCTAALYLILNKDPQLLYRLWVAFPLKILKGRTSIVDSPEPGSEGETFTPNTRLWAILSRVVTVKNLTLHTRLTAQRRVVTVKNITGTTRHSPTPGIESESFTLTTRLLNAGLLG